MDIPSLPVPSEIRRVARANFGDNLSSKNHKRPHQKSKLASSTMSNQPQYNKSNSNANGNNSNTNSNSNNYQKSMDDWLSNNIVNNNNNNNHSTANNNNNHDAGGYQQKNLDDWLNATMKDSPKTFSVSSTEFLDGPPTRNVLNSNGIGSIAPPVNLFRAVPDFAQSQSSFPFVNTFPQPPYLQASNFVSSVNALKMPSHHSDFTSLPPAVNINADTNRSSSQNDLIEGLDNRRFSDPCLAGNSEEETQAENRDNTKAKTQAENNKLLAMLIKQINILHETNSKICRNLNDTKIDIETLKHAPNSWDIRNRRDSISGFSTHSQPMGYSFGGAHSPAPTYHSGIYTPGVMTDLVREVKEGARIREEALLSRVRSMVEERSWTTNETHFKMMRDLEEMKIQINQLKAEKFETRNHITKLEEEIKTLRTLVTHALKCGPLNAANSTASTLPVSSQSTPFDASTLADDRGYMRLNRQQPPNEKRRSWCINYGATVNQEDESDQLRPIQQQFNDLMSQENNKLNEDLYENSENLNHDSTIVQMEKENLELRRGLQDAIANKTIADKKIQNLENIVKSLRKSQTPDNNNVVTISTGHTAAQLNNSNNSSNSNNTANNLDEFAKSTTISPQQIYRPTKVMTTSNGTSTINLTGPVTDL